MNYSPNNARRELAPIKTAIDCFKHHTPSFSEIKKAMGEAKAEAYVKLWLIYLDELLNLKERMSEVQIDEVARLVVSEYYYLKIADLNLTFNRVCKGEYGKTYDRLSISQIMGWFASYSQERAQEVELFNENEYIRLKEVNGAEEADYRFINRK